MFQTTFFYKHYLDFNLVLNPQKDELKPVFMTAANYKYYEPLVETIKNLKKNFPDFDLIIYDLGLKEKNLEVVSIFSFFFCCFLLVILKRKLKRRLNSNILEFHLERKFKLNSKYF